MRRVAAWICGVGGAALGLAALPSAWAGDLVPLAVLHLAGALGVIAALRLRRQVDDSAALIALVIPLLGPALAWWQVVGPAAAAPDALAMQGVPVIPERAWLGQERETPDPAALAPLEDVLHSDASDGLKRSAVESLARLETPEAVQVLRRCLAHASTEVRACAISALGHLERRLAGRIAALETAVRDSDDAVTRLHLAQAYFDCSYYHVATDQRRRRLLEQALAAAERATTGGGAQALILAGRILLELERFAEAEEFFARHLAQQGADVKGLLWHAEALFRQGRYREVRIACARVRALGGVPERMEPAMWMWA